MGLKFKPSRAISEKPGRDKTGAAAWSSASVAASAADSRAVGWLGSRTQLCSNSVQTGQKALHAHSLSATPDHPSTTASLFGPVASVTPISGSSFSIFYLSFISLYPLTAAEAIRHSRLSVESGINAVMSTGARGCCSGGGGARRAMLLCLRIKNDRLAVLASSSMSKSYEQRNKKNPLGNRSQSPPQNVPSIYMKICRAFMLLIMGSSSCEVAKKKTRPKKMEMGSAGSAF